MQPRRVAQLSLPKPGKPLHLEATWSVTLRNVSPIQRSLLSYALRALTVRYPFEQFLRDFHPTIPAKVTFPTTTRLQGSTLLF